jgi:hypothetical protein
LAEVRRILAPGGFFRGSLLLLPRSRWRQDVVRRWIAKGYLSHMVEEETFGEWVDEAGLVIRLREKVGDLLLFELAPEMEGHDPPRTH